MKLYIHRNKSDKINRGISMEDKNIYKLPERLNNYYNLSSDWFDLPYSKFIKANYDTFIKIIEDKYSKMNNNERRYEYLKLKEMIKLLPKEDTIENNYYNLCIDILNKFYRCKLAPETKDIEDIVEENCCGKNNNSGLLIRMWDDIFGFLEKISIFYIIRKLTDSKSHKFVDGWVIGNLIASIASSLLVYNLYSISRILIYFIIIYAILRVFEIIIYQINVLIFHPLRSKNYKIKSIYRMVLALLSNYVEIMFWYTAMVIALVVLNEGSAFRLNWTEYVMSNILCIVTLDGNSIKDSIHNSYSYLSDLIFLEIISGIIMTVISLARFIGILPDVDVIDK